jgi:hypothetical protein
MAKSCPGLDFVMLSEDLEPSQGLDPWDRRFEIACEPRDVHVLSAGSDRAPGTLDDLGDASLECARRRDR